MKKWKQNNNQLWAKDSGFANFAIVDSGKISDQKHRQWIAMVDDGSIANGDDGAPYRHFRQWRSPFMPVPIHNGCHCRNFKFNSYSGAFGIENGDCRE